MTGERQRTADEVRAELARAVYVNRFADCGPGSWWFVVHPDGFLLEVGNRDIAEKLTAEINAGRAARLEAELALMEPAHD